MDSLFTAQVYKHASHDQSTHGRRGNIASQLGIDEGRLYDETDKGGGVVSRSYRISDRAELEEKAKSEGWTVEYKDRGVTEMDRDGSAMMIANNYVVIYERDIPLPKKNIDLLSNYLDPLDNKIRYGGKLDRDLSENEIKTLKEYKGEGYKTINSNLRTSGKETPTVNALDKIIEESSIGMDGYVFRGVSLVDGKNITISDPAFTSWTADSGTAKDFSTKRGGVSVVLALKVSPNNKGVRVDRYTGILGGSEYEVLLPRGISFKEVGRSNYGGVEIIEVEYGN